MTKKEFVKRAAQLRPTARQWRGLIESAINDGLVDYEHADGRHYNGVYPVVAALHLIYLDMFMFWPKNKKERMEIQRKARDIYNRKPYSSEPKKKSTRNRKEST